MGNKKGKKVFKNLDEQVEILKNKGLIIDDEEKTKEILLRENYFFINAYRHVFINEDKHFKDKVIFNELYTLFLFDRNLRNIIFKNILIIENNMKSVISYQMSKKYGYKESEYLKSKNFDYKPANAKQVNDLISKMKKQVRTNGFQHSATRHFMYNYGYIPLWVLIKVLSFGIVSEMYLVLKPEDRIEIARVFGISAEDLMVYLPILANYRNLCAHEDVLYENKTQRSINDSKLHKTLNIKKVDEEYIHGKNDLFALLIIIKRITTDEEFKEMIKEIKNEFNMLSSNIKSIDISLIRERMGFIPDWQKIDDIEK